MKTSDVTVNLGSTYEQEVPEPMEKTIARYLGDVRGDTERLLHVAAKHDDASVIEYLITIGMDVDSIDYRGNTALHEAVLYQCLESFKILLRYGANPDIKNRNGYTAKDLSMGGYTPGREDQGRKIFEILFAIKEPTYAVL